MTKLAMSALAAFHSSGSSALSRAAATAIRTPIWLPSRGHLTYKRAVRIRVLVAGGAIMLVAACSSPSKSSSATSTTTTATLTSTSVPTSHTSLVSTTTTVARTKNTYTGKGNFNSCDVVTAAEAASAIGETVTPGGQGTATSKGGLACVFYGPGAPFPGDPNREQPDSIRAAVFEGPDATADYNDFMPAGAQQVTGYGDQAYFDGSWFSVLKGGDFYLRISVIPGDGTPSLAGEQQLASAILPKLIPNSESPP